MTTPDPYEVVWSGALDRLGLCPELSTYAGASSLASSPATDADWSDGEITQIQRILGVRGRQASRTRSEAQRARRSRYAAVRERDATNQKSIPGYVQ